MKLWHGEVCVDSNNMGNKAPINFAKMREQRRRGKEWKT
jgi:hypothetical protein